MKLKTIVAESPKELDEKVNAFLEDNMEIYKIKFKETPTTDENNIWITAYILYEVNK